MVPTSLTVPFQDLPDPRSPHGQQYSLSAMIAIAICIAICGTEDWLTTFLDLPHGMPSHDTLERCFRLWTTTLAGEHSGAIDSTTPHGRLGPRYLTCHLALTSG